MNNLAEWLAPAATMVAAVMTAANLGARVTGWGFVVFTLGSVCWIIIGLGSDQTGLVVTNVFLTLVNGIGVWRWLGRQARYEAVGEKVESAGTSAAAESVVPVAGLVGRVVTDADGKTVCKVVEAILDCQSGTVRHFVVRFGGVGGMGEQIVAIPFADLHLGAETITTRLSAAAIAALPRLDTEEEQRCPIADPVPAPGA